VQQSDMPSTSAVTDTAVSAPVDNCDVCLVAPMDPRIALVPCGHRRFCGPCAEQVHNRGLCCPMCRSPIQNAVASVLTAFHVSSELCVRCAVTFNLDMCLLDDMR